MFLGTVRMQKKISFIVKQIPSNSKKAEKVAIWKVQIWRKKVQVQSWTVWRFDLAMIYIVHKYCHPLMQKLPGRPISKLISRNINSSFDGELKKCCIILRTPEAVRRISADLLSVGKPKLIQPNLTGQTIS